MGQQIAIGAWTLLVGFRELVFIYRIRSVKEAIRQGREHCDAERASEAERVRRAASAAAAGVRGSGDVS